METFVGLLEYLKNMPIPAIFCNKYVIDNKEVFEVKYVNESMLNIIDSKIGRGSIDFTELFNLTEQNNINKDILCKCDRAYKYIPKLKTWFCVESQILSDSEVVFYFKEIILNYNNLNNGFIDREDYYNFISDDIANFLQCIRKMEKGSVRYNETMDLFLTFIDENEILREDIEEDVYLNKMGDFTNIVHELITPINLIYSSLQVIEKNGSDLLESDQAIRRNINIMKLNTTRVLKLVENIIDFTKLETGYNDFNPETANIVSFIETTCLSIVEFASEKHIELIFESETAELFLSFDKDKIERILLNLLSNSIKYNNENGIIKINLSTKEDYFNIKLIDNGIGIPKDKIEKIFDRYEKVNRVGIGRPRGSGIGLALVKSMVNMHNGKISLKSEVDVGTEFIISLPI